MSIQNEAQMIVQLNAAVVNKAIEDPSFRSNLLEDPKGTIEKALNVPLPSNVVLKIIEAPANEFTVVLPYMPKDGELSDSDLEAVSGGSKSGATEFFNGIGNPIADGFIAGAKASAAPFTHTGRLV